MQKHKNRAAHLNPFEFPFNIEGCEIVESNNPHITLNPICHNYTFEYITKGEGTLICNDKVHHLQKGDLFILHKGASFQYFPDIKKPWTKIKFSCDGILVSNLLVAYSLTDVITVKGFGNERLFKDMLDIYNSGLDTQRTIMLYSLKIHEILQRIYLSQNRNLPKDSAAAIKKILDSNLYKSDFSMKDVSELLNMSKTQIINVFRARYGKTPYQYFIDSRIQLSASMLVNTDMSIKEISDTLNFSDQHYYANVFKKIFGISPKQYRNENQAVYGNSSNK